MKNAETVRIRTLVPPLKSSKNEHFISFNMEFKLKTSENYLKSIKKNLGQYELVLFVPSKIHEKIQDFREIKWKNSQK
jgi:hypothetical protein